MVQVLIRRLDDETVMRLKARAQRAGRSLEEECRQVLREAAQRGDVVDVLARLRVDTSPSEADPFLGVRQRGPGRPVELE